MSLEGGPAKRGTREVLFENSRDQLERYAYRALHKGLSPTEFVILAIDADDPAWSGLANHLVPNGDWQRFRDQGQIPTAIGTCAGGIVIYLKTVVPDIAQALDIDLSTGKIRAVVLADGGANLHLIDPNPHPELTQN